MPGNPTLPEAVRAELRFKIERMCSASGDMIIDTVAPLIIEWAQAQGKIEALEEESRYFFDQGPVDWDGFGVAHAIDMDIAAIRARFTPETTGAPDDHQ